MTEKSKTQNLRRLAHRAGLRIASMRTDAGRIFAVIDGRKIVSTCVGFDAVSQQLVSRASARLQTAA